MRQTDWKHDQTVKTRQASFRRRFFSSMSMSYRNFTTTHSLITKWHRVRHATSICWICEASKKLSSCAVPGRLCERGRQMLFDVPVRFKSANENRRRYNFTLQAELE